MLIFDTVLTHGNVQKSCYKIFLNFVENGVTENGEAAVKDVPKSEKTVVGILNKVYRQK
jgi:hypothetical protein